MNSVVEKILRDERFPSRSPKTTGTNDSGWQQGMLVGAFGKPAAQAIRIRISADT